MMKQLIWNIIFFLFLVVNNLLPIYHMYHLFHLNMIACHACLTDGVRPKNVLL